MQINIGDYCLHTNKWEKSPCRVVAYDEDVVIIKKLDQEGYSGVPESSLSQIAQEEATQLLANTANSKRRARANVPVLLLRVVAVLASGAAFCGFMEKHMLLSALVAVVLFTLAIRSLVRSVYSSRKNRRGTLR